MQNTDKQDTKKNWLGIQPLMSGYIFSHSHRVQETMQIFIFKVILSRTEPSSITINLPKDYKMPYAALTDWSWLTARCLGDN